MPKDGITYQAEFKQEPGLGLVDVVSNGWDCRPVMFEIDDDAYTTNAIENKGRTEVGFSYLASGDTAETELYENSK